MAPQESGPYEPFSHPWRNVDGPWLHFYRSFIFKENQTVVMECGPITLPPPRLASISIAHVWQLLSHRNKPIATQSLWSMAGFMLGMKPGEHGKCVVTDTNTYSARECSKCARILSTSTSTSANYRPFTVFPDCGAGSPRRFHAFPHLCVIYGYSPQFLILWPLLLGLLWLVYTAEDGTELLTIPPPLSCITTSGFSFVPP